MEGINMTLNQVFLTTILPVVLGIITTIIILFVKTSFHGSFMPWYKSKMEKGYIIRGNWKATTNPEYSKNSKYEETIFIQQLSEKIWGDIYYKETIKQTDSNEIIIEKHFEFEGNFTDSVLSAVYWNPDREDKGRGTFCLYSHDSKTLSGKYSWWDPDTKAIETGRYVWEKKT